MISNNNDLTKKQFNFLLAIQTTDFLENHSNTTHQGTTVFRNIKQQCINGEILDKGFDWGLVEIKNWLDTVLLRNGYENIDRFWLNAIRNTYIDIN